MPTTASRRFRRGTLHVRWMSVPPPLLSLLTVGVLAAATLLSACSSEPTALPPELAMGGSALSLTVTPPTLLLRSPGVSKTLTATVRYSGLLTANTSNPACATVSPTTMTSTEKPAGSSVYVAQFTVTGVGMHGCTITVTDKKGNAVSAAVIVSPIAFTSDRSGGIEIYFMDADGQHQTRLTNTTALFSEDPSWFPDESKIALSSSRDGTAQIYVMDADGQNVTRLTNSNATDNGPVWSPDGSKIAFQSDRGLYSGVNIYVMDADGSNVVPLTNTGLHVINAHPSWSPDGTKIAFFSDRDVPVAGDIYVMDADGNNVTRLTDDGIAMKASPAWSPDGTKIAFENDPDGQTGIFVMDPQGQNLTRLTTSPWGFDEWPSWSPDGSKIAFTRRGPSGFRDIWVMNPDGSDQMRLTNTEAAGANNEYQAWR